MRVVNKTAVVFGGTGYLGAHTIVQLYQKGFQIILAEHPSLYNHKNLIGLSELCNSQIKLSLFDWGNETAVSEFINSAKNIDLIVFAGSQYFNTKISHSKLSTNHFYLHTALTVFSVIEKKLSVPLILLSSYKAYGQSKKELLKEEFKLLKGKTDEIELNALLEHFLLLSKKKIKVIITRLSVPIGVHESLKIGPESNFYYCELHKKIEDSLFSDKPFSVKFKKTKKDKKFKSIDFIHIVDACEAIALIANHKLLDKNNKALIYNISSNQAFPSNRFAKALKFFSNSSFNIREEEMSHHECLSIKLSNNKLLAELGWYNKQSLIDAIQSHINYLNQFDNTTKKAA